MNGQRKAVRNFRVAICSLVFVAVLAMLNPQPTRGQSIPFGDPAFARQWDYSDRAVADGSAVRTWLWGPAPLGPARTERMVGSPARGTTPADEHLVQYFDKARMEFNAQQGIVTNGRLVVEMMSGSIQTSLAGDEAFPLLPSTLPIAGDTAVGAAHLDTPTYASLFHIANVGGSGPQATPSVGTRITAKYARSGAIGTLPANAVPSDRMPTVSTFYPPGDPKGHNIPDVFVDFLTQRGLVSNGPPGQYRTDYLFEGNNWVNAAGLPITEPYWAQISISGRDYWVMFQAFERRILTYNPSTIDPLWRVEMGNVGQHYKDWRPERLEPSPLGGVQVVHSSPNPISDVCLGGGAIDGSCPDSQDGKQLVTVPRPYLTILRTENSWARTRAKGWMLLHSDNAIYDMQSEAMLLFETINNSVDSVQHQSGQVDFLHGPSRIIKVETSTGRVETHGTLFSIILPTPAQAGAGGELLRIVVPRQGGSVTLTDPNLPAPGQITVQSGQVLTVIKGPPISASVRSTTPAEEKYWVDKLIRLRNIPEVKDLAKRSVSGTPTACLYTFQFQDVATDDPLYPAALCLVCRGSISVDFCGGVGKPCNGTADPYFQPNSLILRWQIAKVVSQSAGFSEPVGTRIYQDVPEGSPSYAWIQSLSNRGLIGGYPCGQLPEEPCVGPQNRPYFRPNGTTTQGPVARIVSSAANFQEAVSGQTFEDVPPSHTYYVYIERLASRKIVLGYPCGGPGEPCRSGNRPYFRPNVPISKSQITMMIVNTFFPNC